MSPPDRMSPSDSAFWQMESEASRMHNVTLAVLAGPAPTADELEAHVRRRVPLVPRFRQRVVPVPFDLGRPLWVDDPRFVLADHLAAATCDTGFAGLAELVSLLVSRPLARDRPLWHLTSVTGLPDYGWALVSKVHHSLIDGVSGTDLIGVLVDSAAAGHPLAEWRPAPVPGPAERVRQAVTQLLVDPTEQYRAFRASARRGRREVDRLRRRASGADAATDDIGITGPVGSERRWASTVVPMGRLHRLAEAHGAAVHDVVLAVVTSGLRDLMLARDEGGAAGLPDLRAVVPMTVADDTEAAGVPAATIVELPTGEPDVVARLREVRARSAAGADDEVTGSALARLAGFSAPALASLGLREATRAGHADGDVHTVVVTVPGPRDQVTVLGRPMTGAYPVMPLPARVRVSVGAFTYADRVAFGVTTDRVALPDARVVTAGIQHALTDLDRSIDTTSDHEETDHAQS